MLNSLCKYVEIIIERVSSLGWMSILPFYLVSLFFLFSPFNQFIVLHVLLFIGFFSINTVNYAVQNWTPNRLCRLKFKSDCRKICTSCDICTKLENSGTTNNDTSQLLAPLKHRHNLFYRRPDKTKWILIRSMFKVKEAP